MPGSLLFAIAPDRGPTPA